MHAAAGRRRSGLPRGLIALAILCPLPLRATIYIHPNLGFPRPLRNAVVVSTSDGHHVIAVDRTGRELWRLGSRAESAPMNADDEHVLVQLTIIRLESGEALRPATEDAVDLAASGDQLALLRKERIDFVDPATLRQIRDIPAPTRENLRLAIHDGVAMTVGAYNAAAFDVGSGRKLWEIDEQVNATLAHRHVYASVGAAGDRERARLIDVDLDSGETRELYSEVATRQRESIRERLHRRWYRWNRRRLLRRRRRSRSRSASTGRRCTSVSMRAAGQT